MRPPRYRFPNEVRETTRTIAARMVGGGDVARTAQDLDAWIAGAPDVRQSLERGGYGREFTSEDLLPLLEVFVVQAGGAAPAPAAPPRSSRRALYMALGAVLLVLIVVAVVMATR